MATKREKAPNKASLDGSPRKRVLPSEGGGICGGFHYMESCGANDGRSLRNGELAVALSYAILPHPPLLIV